MIWYRKYLITILLLFDLINCTVAQSKWNWGITASPTYSHIRILTNYTRYDYSYKTGKFCHNGFLFVKNNYHDMAFTLGVGYTTNGSQGYESFAYIYPPKKSQYTKLTHQYVYVPIAFEYPLSSAIKLNIGLGHLIPVATKKSTVYFENDIEKAIENNRLNFVIGRKYNLTLSTGLKIYLPKMLNTNFFLQPDINFTILNYKLKEQVEARFTLFGLGLGVEFN